MPWDEADTKTNSLIDLPLGQEAINIFHQRDPHTEMSKCTKDAFIEQLKETFREVRNETFDRYQFFNCKQEVNEPPEKFKTKGSTMQLGGTRRKPSEKYIPSRNEKRTNTNGSLIRR